MVDKEGAAAHVPTEEDLGFYRSLFEAQVEDNVSVGVILNCMVATIARVGDPGRRSESSGLHSAKIRNGDGLIVVDYRDGILARFAEIVRGRGSLASSALVEGEHTIDIERRYHASLPFPGDVRRRGMPRIPLRSTESRGMERTAFKTFLGDLDPHAVEHAQMTEKFQELMRRADSSAMDAWGSFHDRCWVEPLDAKTLPQAVAEALSEFGGDASEVHYVYDSRSDQLLLAVHTRTAERRHCAVTRTAVPFCNFRPAFASWPRMDLAHRPAMFQLEAMSLRALERDVQYLYPADHAVIRAEQAPPVAGGVSTAGSTNSRGVKHASVTVYKDGHVFGLRVAPSQKGTTSFPAQFVAAWGHEHATRTVVSQGPSAPLKPDGHGTMRVTNTCACGLVVEHCSNGAVCQRYAVPPGDGTPHTARGERSRLLVGSSGAVVRVLDDGQMEVLHANGDISTRESAACGYWIRTLGPRGQKFRVPDNMDIPERESGEHQAVDVRRDPVSGADVCTREDGTVVVTYADGSMLARHSDGTTMLTTCCGSEQQTVVVEAKGFATCTVYSGVDATARAHAKGARVAITRGGVRTRSTSSLPDGTVVELLYDTRITSNINGFVVVKKSDGTTVTASDNGTVKFRPVSAAGAGKGDSDDDGDGLTSNGNFGVYHFDCSDASMQVADPDNNVFRIDSAVTHGLQGVDIDLAGICDGVIAVPVINDPVHPRLFVMRGDGTGFELLREVDSRRYNSLACDNGSSGKRDGRTVPHTFLEEIGGDVCESKPPTMPLTVRQTDPFVAGVDQALYQTARLVRVRNVLQYLPLDNEQRSAVRQAEREYMAWKQAQAETEGRFSVDDPRPGDDKDSEARMQRKIAKVRRRINREQKRSRNDRKPPPTSQTTARADATDAHDSGDDRVLIPAGGRHVEEIEGFVRADGLLPTDHSETPREVDAPAANTFPEASSPVRQPTLQFPKVRVPWDATVTTGHFWTSEEGKAFLVKGTARDDSQVALDGSDGNFENGERAEGIGPREAFGVVDSTEIGIGNSGPVESAGGPPAAPGQQQSTRAPPPILSSTGVAPNYGNSSVRHLAGTGARAAVALASSEDSYSQLGKPTLASRGGAGSGRTNKGRAAEFDVVGNARTQRVHTRSVRKSGLRGAPVPASGRVPGSIELFPGEVRFGSLLVGGSYRAPFEILNVSNSLQRYRIIPHEGIGIIHDPGALAPGMKKVVWVEILAHSCGSIHAEVEVRSQYETFRLPVIADVVDAEHHLASDIAAGVLPTKVRSGTRAL